MISRRALLTALPALPLFKISVLAEEVMPTSGDQTRLVQDAIDKAYDTTRLVRLGPGTFDVGPLTIRKDVTIIGVPGLTKIHAFNGGKIFSARTSKTVVLQGLTLSSKGPKGNLFTAENIEQVIIEDCDFASGEAGIRVASCGGRIVNNRFRFHSQVGVQAIASTGLLINNNVVSDIGNVGIQVFRDDKGDNATIVSNNIVSRIAAESGGDGPNGNGINIYASHGVIVSNNRISDCAFTGIRNASSDNCSIIGNQISRCDEVGLYVEFYFAGAVVADNIIDTAAHGISITNFKEGGRLAQCTGNVLRNIRGVDSYGNVLGGGIAAEADTVIANNAIDGAAAYGIGLGWGVYGRNLSAIGNIISGSPQGIRYSTLAPGPFVIANNIISGASKGAVLGMDHDKPVSTDLLAAGAVVPESVSLSGNRSSSGI